MQEREQEQQDRTDAHIARWSPLLPGRLDPDVEGAVTRMQKLVKHLRRFEEQFLAAHDLQKHEFETLHVLAGHGDAASPSAIAAELDIAPASVTGRLTGLERRGFVRRTPSPDDRRRVDVELTDSGRRTWLGAIDGMGREEQRLLGALDAGERRSLAGMLRRVMLEAERSAAKR
ncbi:MarR family winged helix-turn-helix transcriptional regulator [Streptomyces meridianus]|uniref:MarR family transcriptional regulator n=1 Tax=Streptomyces meridianus TaxID=2938945 RepID=A0ABT0X7L5_9ACTN|nr:MarR family transcriptional regulator [Streptomyces meridianus]MCM2577938.1 MarR family transcriptional regulator [Streptomyces meridianus]